MADYLSILDNTLEGMSADAEDKGKETIQPMLTLEDVKIILSGLRALKPCNTTAGENYNSPLKETVDGMLSADYKERFKAEYHQTKIRYTKLHKMLIKAEAGTLEFTPTCPTELLRNQKRAMGEYLYHLEVRAEIEGIEL